ncbi:primosomal protein N', partial [Candidatus Microgenomates bacterium]|nr:primosomal protein N' [Candidatus Microgenomates bacterium]
MVEATRYYDVAPLAAAGSKKALFTYHYGEDLRPGSLVKIPFGPRTSLGIVIIASSKPEFPTKPITATLPLPALPKHTLELAAWISDYYATPLSRVWHSMLPSSLASKPRQSEIGNRKTQNAKKSNIRLIKQQTDAIKQIQSGKSRNFLLHGATGSGKTQVYVELAKLAAQRGRSTIVLVPEISLTPQATGEFLSQLGQSVLLTHSGLTPAKRRNLWQQVLDTSKPLVVIGPRSALFMPLMRVGYIIIDEAQDSSYKQDQAPRYQAVSVGAKLAKLTNAKLVLGSATPSATDLFLAQAKRLRLVSMPDPIFRARQKRPQIVDLRTKDLLKKSFLISKPLLTLLEKTLARRKQSILFLNRRGSARMALCAHCSWVATCPNCQIPLTWHADFGRLRCHWCNHEEPPPAQCPDCGRMSIRFLGSGTKRVEAEVKKLLPNAKITRLDRDSFDARTIEDLYRRLKAGEIDILIGTQMITKGLDLPGVETIGIILADTMLYLPDFSAAERTWQLLYQVRGRAGRRQGVPANLVIQTYSPKHPAIQAAASGDIQGFVKQELAERKLLNYPPYTYLLKLSCARASRESAQKAA